MLRRLSRAISLPQSKPKTTQRSESPPPKRELLNFVATKAAVLIEASTQSVPITAEAAIQAGNQGVLGVDVFGAPAPAPPAARQLFANTSAELGVTAAAPPTATSFTAPNSVARICPICFVVS